MLLEGGGRRASVGWLLFSESSCARDTGFLANSCCKYSASDVEPGDVGDVEAEDRENDTFARKRMSTADRKYI